MMPTPAVIDLSNPVADHPLNRGLVSWWLPLPNTGGGTTLIDLVATGRNHLTLTNGPTWATGPNGTGQALSLTAASSQYAQYSGAVVTAVPLTMACWFNVNNVTGDHCLVSLGASGSEDYFGLIANGSIAGDPIRAPVRQGASGAFGETTTSFSAGVWSHACAVFATNANRTAYLNGGGAGSDTTSLTPASMALTGVGRLSRLTPAFYTDGRITDVRIYNRALSADEVLALYRQGLRGNPDTLRRFAPRVWSFGGAAAAGGGNRRRRVLLTARG